MTPRSQLRSRVSVGCRFQFHQGSTSFSVLCPDHDAIWWTVHPASDPRRHAASRSPWADVGVARYCEGQGAADAADGDVVVPIRA